MRRNDLRLSQSAHRRDAGVSFAIERGAVFGCDNAPTIARNSAVADFAAYRAVSAPTIAGAASRLGS
jgi:hypothetical protein